MRSLIAAALALPMLACGGTPMSNVDCTILEEAKNGGLVLEEMSEITRQTEKGRISIYKNMHARYEYLEAKCVEIHSAYTYGKAGKIEE